MAEQAFKPTFLDLLRYARLAQDTFLQELNADERAAVGTPEYWSAKDHIAHMTFWRQRLVLTLTAILQHQEIVPEEVDFERYNRQIFEEQQHRSWSNILAESEQVYTKLIALTEQFTEEELTAFNRFNWHPDGEPLYAAFLGNCYEHTQQHLAQYYLDRHDPARARQIYEVWAQRAIEAEVPDTLKGIVLYNLACFYATHTALERATTTLQQALTLAPHLQQWSLNDPELDILREQPL